MLRDLYKLLRSWWQVDRVRISPAEGRLLRLIPPCIISVNGRSVEVLRRSVDRKTSEPIVQYDGLCEGRTVQLIVTPRGKGRTTSVVWFENGRARELCEFEVETYGSRGTYRNSMFTS